MWGGRIMGLAGLDPVFLGEHGSDFGGARSELGRTLKNDRENWENIKN